MGIKTSKTTKQGCLSARASRSLALLLAAIPLTAYPLTLSDYLNISTVTASSDQFETNFDNNDDQVQIVPNAEIIIVKEIVNDDGGDLVLSDFSLATSAGVPSFGAGAVTGTTTTYTSDTIYVPPGTYTLVEADLPGYTEGSWSCSTGTVGNSAFDSGEVTLAFGEQTVCTITNDDIAPQLTLAKTVVNDNGGDLLVDDFDISIDGVEVANNTATAVTANIDVVISELDLDGYTEGTWACVDANGLTTGLPTAGAATGETFQLKQGSDVTCSISNDDIAPQLTLVKTVVNDNGGDLLVDDFDISINSVEVANNTATAVSANTDIVISELDLDGYTEGTWACVDANGLTAGLPTAGAATGETFQLKQGSDVTCSISNDDIAPQLTLAKTVVNDNGGNAVLDDFDISIDGVEVANNTATAVTANTDILISELDLDGYTEGTWACVDVNGLTTGLPTAGAATGETFQLKQGSDVTCSITNDDLAPLLTLTKTVINDNGGDLLVEDFDISIDGTEVVNSAPTPVASNQPITISELDLDGYTEGTWACVDSTGLTTGLPTAGAATGVDVTLVEGANVTCSISNDDIAPQLTLTKTVVNDNGGDLLVDDFDISIDGVEVANNTATAVTANTDILISELDLDGYTEGTWACVDASGLTTGLPTAGAATGETFQLKQGSDVTCSISNDDIAPRLTLSKTVVNDNGGDLIVDDFDIAIDGLEVINNMVTAVSANTDIVISELDLDGYTEGTWACVDASGLTTGLPTAGAATGETFQLKQGSDVTCSISNDDIAPQLTLAKTVVNDNGGDLLVDDFDISIDSVEVANNTATAVSANTDIVISELDLDGYTEGTWACVDSSGLTTGLPTAGVATGETFQLKQGADVTCSISNDDIAPQLTLAKTVVNDNGGDLLVDDFDISIDSVEVANNTATAVSANTDIVISELDLDGYTAGTWACVDANGLTTGLPTAGVATGETFQLKQGSDVTCSISNDDIAPQLTLVKTVVNDNGGTAIIDDFDISIDGIEVASGVASPVQANTDIVISELDLTPYAEGTWECVDATGFTAGLPAAGLATGETIQLTQGADVTCSITNNDLGIDLSIAKTVDDPTPNIGQTITFTLTVVNNGPDVATAVSVNDVVPAGFTYVAGSISGGDSSNDADPAGGGLDWTLNSVAVGVPVVLTFDALVNVP